MFIVERIKEAIKKFNPNLRNKIVLTEAATGNYVVCPIISALSGADVYAFTKDSIYGDIGKVRNLTYKLAKRFNVLEKILIITDLRDVDLSKIDILTNSGHLRPINREIVSKLSNKCVIPLMWEPWEYRKSDLDLEACLERGIKVYGTNEADERLKTLDYIGFIVLYFLLHRKYSPMSAKILLLGDEKFGYHISRCLKNNSYKFVWISFYTELNKIDIKDFNVIVCAEHINNIELIGKNGLIKPNYIPSDAIIIHIAGNVDLKNFRGIIIPKAPKPFGYMSFTTDFIDITALIDLFTAGLKVAEGMLIANELKLSGIEYKKFIEEKYIGKAFDDPRFW